MTDNQIQKLSLVYALHAEVEHIKILMESMKVANQERISRNESLAYSEGDFDYISFDILNVIEDLREISVGTNYKKVILSKEGREKQKKVLNNE